MHILFTPWEFSATLPFATTTSAALSITVGRELEELDELDGRKIHEYRPAIPAQTHPNPTYYFRLIFQVIRLVRSSAKFLMFCILCASFAESGTPHISHQFESIARHDCRGTRPAPGGDEAQAARGQIHAAR